MIDPSIIEISDDKFEKPRKCRFNNDSLVLDTQLTEVSRDCNKSWYNEFKAGEDLTIDATLPHYQCFENVNDELGQLYALWNSIGYTDKERDDKLKVSEAVNLYFYINFNFTLTKPSLDSYDY